MTISRKINTNRRNAKGDKYCTICKLVLTDKNWSSTEKKYGVYTCKNCMTNYKREYARMHIIGQSDCKKVIFRVKKRISSGKCELCGKDCYDKDERISYHHWEDDFPQMGIWLCLSCHMFAERFDKNYMDKYLNLKIREMIKLVNQFKR